MTIPALPISAGSSYPDPGGSAAVGVQATGFNGELLTWTGAEWGQFSNNDAEKIRAAVSGAGKGPRLVLFGDSMVDTIHTPVGPSALSYNASTGDLTITSTGHQQAVGWPVEYWNRNYSGTYKFGSYAVQSVTDANTFVINIGANVTGVPNGSNSVSGGVYYRARSWQASESSPYWFLAHSDWRFSLTFNGGQSGDTTGDCLARLQQHCLAYSPDVIYCQCPGINDINAGTALETIWTNIVSLVTQMCASGARVILLNITPVASGEARATKTNMGKVRLLNRRLAALCATAAASNVILVDAYSIVVSVSDASGYADTAMVRTVDKIHYSMNGGQRVGKAAWDQVASAFPSMPNQLPASNAESWTNSSATISACSSNGATPSSTLTFTSTAHGFKVGDPVKIGGGSPALNALCTVATAPTANSFTVLYPGVVTAGAVTGTIYAGHERNLFDNPCLTTATGGTLAGTNVSGVAAQSLKVFLPSGTVTSAVCSVVARSDGIGNDQQVVITPSAAAQIALVNDFALSNTLLPGMVAAGRTYVFEGYLTLTGVSGSTLTEVRPVVTINVGGTSQQSFAQYGYSNGSVLARDVTNIHFRTAPMLLPAGAVASVGMGVYLSFSGVGSAVTAKLGRLRFEEYVA